MALTKIHLKVDGMTCSHCDQAISRAIRSLDGIQSVEVDRKSGMVIVAFNDSLASPAQINAAIEDLGIYGAQILPAV